MICWFIEQQDIRILQYEAAEVHARLFAARERVEQPLAHLRRDGKSVCHLVDRRFRIIAAEGFKLGGKLAVAAQRPFALVAVRHLLREGVHLVFKLLHPCKGTFEHILDRIARGVNGDL